MGRRPGLLELIMQSDLDAELSQALEELQRQGLHRALRGVDSPQGGAITLDGRSVLNFSSNDYLGLASAPTLKEAAIRAVQEHGAGSGASRLISGSLAPHRELEESLADFKQTEAALTFSTGYATAIGAICALLGRGDILIMDKLVHACIVDAARLCGATLRVFAHNDLGDLEMMLVWARRRQGTAEAKRQPRVLVVTESLFSMDGDHAPLRQIVALKEAHGAWLMVDEAHATGLYGKARRGLAEELEVSDQIEVQMGTLGKAVGAAGGYICGSRRLIELLVNRARSFIFSTAPVPASAAAARAGIEVIRSAEGAARCARLWQRHSELKAALPELSLPVLSPIVPLMIGDEQAALCAAAKLLEKGLFLPAIRYPTVARGTARLRLSFSAAHEPEDIARLGGALREAGLHFAGNAA